MAETETEESRPLLQYSVNRKVLQRSDVEKIAGCKNPTSGSVTELLKTLSFKKIICDLCPVLRWLPNYEVRKDLVGDIIAGITVAVMHIPQGMAYGLLSGVDPVVGLYVAFFPTLVYFMFGTSRHVSMGTFAIVSLLTAKIVATYTDPSHANGQVYSPFEVATAVTMVTGIYHLIMFVLRLGTLSALLSESLVNGFTTGATIHVIISQMKDLLGVNIPKNNGYFKVILSIRDIVMNIETANLCAIYVSIVTVVFMIVMNELIKPWASKRCKLPIPAELIAVMGFTVVSFYMNLGTRYGVKEVGEIPTGLPIFKIPSMTLMKLVAVDSIAVTVVSYVIVMSMGLIFATKDKYELRANQELLAMGLANIVGSFFECIPVACSLSRSLIQHQTGGKTQLASVVSAGLILIVLLWIGPLFEALPRATLAGIIIVALKGMILQVKDLKRFRNEGFLEMLVWIVTFLVVVIVDINTGLFSGILVSIFALYFKGWRSYSCLLGQVPGTDIYIDGRTRSDVNPLPGIRIFHFVGSINFFSKLSFKKELFKAIGEKALQNNQGNRDLLGDSFEALIIDLSAVAHLDSSGCKIFAEIEKDLKVFGVELYLASANDKVYKALGRSSFYGGPTFDCFATVHDAVLYAQSKMSDNS